MSQEASETLLHPVAEIALIILLFLDAAQIDLSALRIRHTWPVRMLTIGLPLSIAFGTVAAMVLFPEWPIVAAALIASILAATDAALGQAVVTHPDVPMRPRRALTVESGLNDGLALPAVLLFASLTVVHTEQAGTDWIIFVAMQLLLGPLTGGAVGAIGGSVFLRAKAANLTTDLYEGPGVLALAGVAYLGATLVGGNGFISAFIAGLSFGGLVKGRCKFIFEFTEGEGQLLSWSAFLLLGAAMVPEAISYLTWQMLAFILLSLFVVRPLAIYLSLVGTDASPTTRVFFGWFGPRGLASALFALLVVDQIADDLADQILYTAINAVSISALLHGVTAAPLARRYGRKTSRMHPCPETQKIDGSARPVITRTT